MPKKTARDQKYRLSPRQLGLQLPRGWLPFKNTTGELRACKTVVGQARAMHAVELGLKIPTRGYNVYVAGEAGSGKTSTIERLLRERARSERVPEDLCYVHNFHQPANPRPIQLPAGQGRQLASGMDQVVEELSRMIPRVLSEGAFGHIRSAILADAHAALAKLMQQTVKLAEQRGLHLEEDEEGLRLIPLIKGKPIDPETYEQLTSARRRRIEASMVAFQEHLEAYAYRRRQLEVEHQQRMLEAEVRAISPLVRGLFAPLEQRFRPLNSEVADYLMQVERHVLENHRGFLPPDPEGEEEEEISLPGLLDQREHYRIYKVNVVVDRSEQKGAPVVLEQVPSTANLSGYFEYQVKDGQLATDHLMIRAGALHQANGGYLLLQMTDLLTQENAWERLKRALRHKQVRIEEEAGLGEGKVRIAGSLKPGSVPLQVKVFLIGGLELYYLLKLQDENFRRLFKIMAEFESTMPCTQKNVTQLARFLGQVCVEEENLPLHRSGMLRLVEYAARSAEHKERMTTHRAALLDLMAEANFFASQSGAKAIRAEDVERALCEGRHRNAAAADMLDRAIREGTIIIRTRGRAVAQINGIALYDLAGTTFGMPVRITVRTYVGRRGVVNIDREVSLSGAIHDKGGMILVGYLGGRYAQEHTLGLSASVTFEQSYDEIDGDSASCAELYALLSALADCPIRQGVAVTGSVNQLGEIQPIGGVNEKIEGIFRVCKSRGLSGDEGVMVPAANVKNLVLSREVIEAVRAGKFNIYAVSTIDEGIEVLSGLPAGTRRKDGSWTPGSINERVQRTLRQFQQVLRAEGSSAPMSEPRP